MRVGDDGCEMMGAMARQKRQGSGIDRVICVDPSASWQADFCREALHKNFFRDFARIEADMRNAESISKDA